MADKTDDPNPGHAMFGLNDPQPRRATPAEGGAAPSAGNPQIVYVQAPPSGAPAVSSGGKGLMLMLLVVVLLIISGVNLFLVITGRQQLNEALSKHTDQLDLVTRRLDSSDQRYAQLSGKFQVTSEKLGLTERELTRARSLAADIQKQQETAVQQLNDAISKKATTEAVNKLETDTNAKMGGISTDLAGTKKDLEATKEALTGAKGELTGAIARTHDELVALAHKSDRDFFEFNLARKGSKQKLGTVQIELEKTNPKKRLYTVNLVFDDQPHPYRDKPTNEPLFFYVNGASSALELVVNKMGKDSIAGYVSTPKGFFSSTPNVLGARPGA